MSAVRKRPISGHQDQCGSSHALIKSWPGDTPLAWLDYGQSPRFHPANLNGFGRAGLCQKFAAQGKPTGDHVQRGHDCRRPPAYGRNLGQAVRRGHINPPAQMGRWDREKLKRPPLERAASDQSKYSVLSKNMQTRGDYIQVFSETWAKELAASSSTRANLLQSEDGAARALSARLAAVQCLCS